MSILVITVLPARCDLPQLAAGQEQKRTPVEDRAMTPYWPVEALAS